MALRLLEENLKSAGGIGHFVLGLFDAGVDVIEGEQTGDGDAQTASKRASPTPPVILLALEAMSPP